MRSTMGFLTCLRERYHPFHRLKRYGLSDTALYRLLDRPFFRRPRGITFPVRMRLMRHLAYVVDSRIVEPGIFAFVAAYPGIEPIVDFWDVGANFGFYGWLVLSAPPPDAAPAARVIFIEPDRDNIALIRATIARNGLTNARLIEAAANDREGEAEFLVDRVSGMTGSLETVAAAFNERHYRASRTVVSIPTVTLDSLARRHAGPTLMKVDVEGAEQRVFAGAMTMLAERQPTVIFEVTPGKSAGFHADLVKMGYRILGADYPDQPVEAGFNRVALPRRLHDREADLARAWRAAYAQIGGARPDRAS